MSPTAARRERLEAGDREQPSGDGKAAFKAASLLPHVEEHIAQKVFGDGLIADEPEQPTVNRVAMPGEQHLHVPSRLARSSAPPGRNNCSALLQAVSARRNSRNNCSAWHLGSWACSARAMRPGNSLRARDS